MFNYRQITVYINRKSSYNYNHKKNYRLMNFLSLKSVVRRKNDITEFKYDSNKKFI